MPSQTNPSPEPSAQSGETGSFLSQFGKSSDSTEFYSPLPPGYQRGRHKYVVVLGTVMSGLGKGIFSSSLAKLLKDKGLTVAPIKMEGYLNVDSGTLNPYRHGEVFVLDDGMETDMDLGTYERMLDQNLSRDNFVTAGQVYSRVLEKERHGGYLGRDVQMIPHVTGEVKYLVRNLAVQQKADVVFVEVGGTVGDFENGFYIEAMRELAFEEGPGSVCFVALTYVIEPESLGEQKSKAAQLGIKRLMEVGIQPHMIGCRAHNPASQTVMQKIAMFSNVPMRRVFSMHDRASIYTIPTAMWSEGLDREILSILSLHERVNPVHEEDARSRWAEFSSRLTTPRRHRITLGLAGKYAALRDAYASIDKAIEHCAAHLSAAVDLRWIDTTECSLDQLADRFAEHQINGFIVPGGFGQRGVDGKIACAEFCRTQRIPYLGICLGFQVAVIEYARHVAGLDHANSIEFDPDTPHPVVSELPEQKKIEGLGGTMRLGAQDIILEPDSMASYLYGERKLIRERFRHRYEVDPAYIDRLSAAGLRFSGRHPHQPIMQLLELPGAVHPYFMAAQFHPELTGRPLHPQPMFMGLIAAAIQHAHPDLDRGQISERWIRANGTGNDHPSQKLSNAVH